MTERKNDSYLIESIHEAALNLPLNELCEKVVIVATNLVGAENGRFRFVDYTEKKLVPGAVKGALADRREMAVRDIGECIVGQAALQLDTVYVKNVSKNKHFIQFKEKIKSLSKTNPEWKKYHDETLEYVGSEIATPVLAGKTLLGVLSVHAAKKDSFREKDIDLLTTFASEIAVAFLHRRAVILEELHKIEEKMISVFELKQVAQQIAEGIRRMVEGGIPNIFLYDEDFEEKGIRSPFQFLTSAGASDYEKELGFFEPRWTPRFPEKGRGMEAIEKSKSGDDPFVVVEDVQNDSAGSPTARERGVRTTCCLPLVFKGSIVGVLYLHFKERHFFTIEEKRTLKMFAIPAAIAIKNAVLLPTWAEVTGNGIIEQLDQFEPQE